MSTDPRASQTRRGGLLGSGATVAGMTFLSRVSGLVRDVAVAAVFGASGSADAFFVAFRIPNLFRRMFAEGAFSQGFVPVLTEYRISRSASEVRALIDHVSGSLAAVLLVLTILGVVAAPLLVWLIAPGFDAADPRRSLTIELTRLTFPYLAFVSLVAMAAGVQNTWQRFALPAATPILLNVSLITAVWFAAFSDPAVLALGWGVMAAGSAQLLVQLPALWRLGLLPRPRIDWSHPGVRRIAALMVPAMLGASVVQLNLLVDTLLASFLTTGSISWLYYADRLMELPVGLVAAALGTVVLPALSVRVAEGDQAAFSATLDWGLRWALLLALPAGVALLLLAPALIATIFNYGALSAVDVRQSSAALSAYAIGVPGFVAIKVLAPGYFSRQDTRTPVRIAMLAVLVNVTLNLLLIWQLAHVGLALATAIAALANAGLLAAGLLRGGIYRPGAGWARFALAVVFGCATLAAFLLLCSPSATWWLAADVVARVAMLAGITLGGLACYAAGALLGGLRWRHLADPEARLS